MEVELDEGENVLEFRVGDQRNTAQSLRVIYRPAPQAAASPPGYVSSAEYGEDWPLTVPNGELRCVEPSMVLFRAPDGRLFPVNGAAQGFYTDLPEIEEIWALNPDPLFAESEIRISISPLIQRGLQLCE
jgi:hypothetical protein